MIDRTFAAEISDGVLWVRGEIDDYGIIALRNLLAEHATAPGARLVVELSDVDYLPSVAVGVLTRALGAAQRSGAEVELVARRGSMAQRVLMVAALPYRDDLDGDFDPPGAGITA